MPKQEPTVQDRPEEETDVPPVSEAAVVAARQEQSKEAKRATFAMLKSKVRKEQVITFLLAEDDPVTMKLVSLGSQEYDKLVTKHPPKTPEQKMEGAGYDINTFAPALLARVVVDPDMTPAEWTEIWESPDWNRGEVLDLFTTAAGLCVEGLRIPLS
jgi:hypothetical protein